MGVYLPNETEKGFFYAKSVTDRTKQFIFLVVMMILTKIFLGLAIAFIALITLATVLMYLDFINRLENLNSEQPPEK